MKGLYMVDADRGFVQYFENLLFTNSQEYKMLGHNFKANDFLMKIKERPDLLNKIDLLFVNPKLNDLNGLELIKKIQVYKKDINICILVNENIKTFYENDIAELGIENVIVYPNEDTYYLESVKKVFDNIENNARKMQTPASTQASSEKVVDTDVFAELNSASFLSQFDFDSLSEDFFKDKKVKEEPMVSEHEYKEEVNPINRTNEGSLGNGSFGLANPYEVKSEPTPVPVPENTFARFDEVSNSNQYESNTGFIKPAFGFEEEVGDVGNNGFAFNTPSYDAPSYNAPTFEEPKYKTPIFEEPNFEDAAKNYEHGNLNSNRDYESPKTNQFEGYNEYRTNDSLGEDDYVPGNPLDLSAFGVKTDSYNNNAPDDRKLSTPAFKEPEFGVNQFDFEPKNQTPSYGNMNTSSNPSPYGLNDAQVNPYANPYVSDDFTAPYESAQNVPQKSNLQSLDRPDIDGVESFENYGQPTNSFDNPPSGVVSGNGLNGFNREPIVSRQPIPERGSNTSEFTRRDYINNGSNGSNGYNPQPMEAKPNNTARNPYDEYVKNNLRQEESQSSQFGGYNDSPKVDLSSQFGNPSEREDIFANVSTPVSNKPPVNGFTDMNKPNLGVNNLQNTPHKQFAGFDFGKSEEKNMPINMGYEPQSNDFDELSMQGMGNGNSSNKAVIENMYNNTGVDSLSYTPSMNGGDRQAPITHDRTSNSAYNEIPDFAKQIVAFYSTKGGIGKTSLAVNSTIQLAKYSKKKICLVDFDVTNANVHTHLGILDSVYDLSVISNFESEIDSFSLSRIVTPYRVKDKNGSTVEFDVIVGFKEMKMSQRFSEKEVYKILCILEEMYDIVIVDTHPVYTDLAVSTILKKATKIVFVSEQEMTALNGANDFILTSKKYGIPAEKLFMVLNRYKPQTTIFTKNRIEKGLNKTVLATIPSDMDSLRDSVNTNNPVTIGNPDSELSRAYIDVAKIIDRSLVVPEESKGFFKRFKK